MYSPMSIAIPPVFLPKLATQFPNTATAAWDTSNVEAIADVLPGFNSNWTVQSPRTASKLEDKVALLEDLCSGILTPYLSKRKADIPCPCFRSAFAKSNLLLAAFDPCNGIPAVCDNQISSILIPIAKDRRFIFGYARGQPSLIEVTDQARLAW